MELRDLIINIAENLIDDGDKKTAVIKSVINYFDTQNEVTKWKLFNEHNMPDAGKEIWIVWSSGNFPPEMRILTENDLQQDWSDMRWMYVPNYRQAEK